MRNIECERLQLQAELDAGRSRQDRNLMGQFATPDALAIEILRSARNMLRDRSDPVTFMDPAFGTGSFYSALLREFPKSSIVAAHGFEVDPHYGKPAARLWGKTDLQLELEDFTTRSPGHRRVDLLVCNPPYVRHHHIDGSAKTRLQERVKHEIGTRVSGLAGLYVYFMLLSHKWLAADSLSIWLIPSEFMDVNYGSALKTYLLDHVDLIRIHRFDPNDGQFADALVSSAVVWFRSRPPSVDSAPEFTFGGTFDEPQSSRRICRSELRRERKWTRFPRAAAASSASGPILNEFFSIRRGIVTGANSFFIMDRERADALDIPSRFLQPVLPSPRYVTDNIIKTDKAGLPKIERPLFVFRCDEPFSMLEHTEPACAKYILLGEQQGLDKRYLASRRQPWYSLEFRDRAPFLCTYMGRSMRGNTPFRIILNESEAIATNVYLMLYPNDIIRRIMADETARYKVLTCLQRIIESEWESSGRVYGGGLFKLEPGELGGLGASPLLDAFPEIGVGQSKQLPLAFMDA